MTTKEIIDASAREWLAQIQDYKREMVEVSVLLQTEVKRREKLRSPKFQRDSDALIAAYEQRVQSCTRFVEDNTREFFHTVLGIAESTPVALKNAAGQLLGALIVTDFTANLLSDGTGTFHVSGDSLTEDLLPGRPNASYLLAQESAGQWLVPLI